ncbi:hypothetical protein [Bacillus badius]|uniref:Uncharacterized protein n=1 Tax=Bacillus badius TaxID=1455 RepID=A0ABR5ASC3_BACBA|nr:hypothetical protein [Bacillus badius]KIL73869.1 hypothetical protein SD78_2927 [Bacillus badius]KIL77073.1 hypothetical protein SD77_1825 [Bacillus badius]MED0668075.1 hypothetical protein [Bacillus badius]MED4717854.1 hypothetical protein [Bacillus badius]UAT32942.1 hypothetical protein K7T73_20075 [Bacillus badius]
MDKELATRIVQSGWGNKFRFDMEDSHALYFVSPTEEIKVHWDEEKSYLFAEGRTIGDEDWCYLDCLSKKEVQQIENRLELEKKLGNTSKQNHHER